MGLCDKLLPLLDLKQYTLSDDIDRKKSTLLKETCFMISNITAGTQKQIDCMIKNNIFSSLINLLKLKKAPFEIRKEAAWAISNATLAGDSQQIGHLVRKGAIEVFIPLLETQDQNVLLVVMEGLNNILKCGENIKNAKKSNENGFAIRFESAGGLDKVAFGHLFILKNCTHLHNLFIDSAFDFLLLCVSSN